jgi:hypothetical protein
MADEPDHILLQYMRRFDERQERMAVDIHDIKVRLTNVEENQTIAHRRLDRIDERLDRIEKRLELIDSPYGGVRE